MKSNDVAYMQILLSNVTSQGRGTQGLQHRKKMTSFEKIFTTSHAGQRYTQLHTWVRDIQIIHSLTFHPFIGRFRFYTATQFL